MAELYRHRKALLTRFRPAILLGLSLFSLFEPAAGFKRVVGHKPADTIDGPGELRYFLEPTLQLPIDTVVTYQVTVEDSIPNDTLFQLRSAEGFPVAYYRKINTAVCFDGKRSEEYT